MLSRQCASQPGRNRLKKGDTLHTERLSGNSIGFLDRLTDLLKMGDGLKMSDFGLGMS